MPFRHRWKLMIALLFLLVVGWQAISWAAQEPPAEPLFIPFRTVGAARPAGLLYEPNADRFAWVDDVGQLMIVDGETLAVQHAISPGSQYAAYNFSRDGRWLAVAIDLRVEVYDVASGALTARFEPPGARRVQGPLQFTRNDELLVFDTLVPAPPELRRSENDTIILPWVWDVAAARNERRSVLPNRVDAYPYYGIRVSMVAGDDGVLLAGLFDRIQILDADSGSTDTIADYQPQRLETDPVFAYRSASAPLLYLRLNGSGGLSVINTETNTVQPLDLGRDRGRGFINGLADYPFMGTRTVIGDGSNETNALTALLLGSNYIEARSYAPTALTLLDVLIPLDDDPLASAAGRSALLVYDFNERAGVGRIDLIRPGDAGQIVLSPNRDQLAIRRGGTVELYDIASGALTHILQPSEPDPEARRTFAYTDDGRTLVIDFERYDALTGERLARVPNFTDPFSGVRFLPDGALMTFHGENDYQVWDAETGLLIREDRTYPVQSGVIARSADGFRTLSRLGQTADAVTLQISDPRTSELDTFTLPIRSGFPLGEIIPNADWSRFILTYSVYDASTGGTAIEVVTLEGDSLYFDAGNNLLSDLSRIAWRDNRTIQIRSYGGDQIPSAPRLGLDYHPSGLPQCVVDRLPNDWQDVIPLWELLLVTRGRDDIGAITERLCTALTGEGATRLSAAEATPAIPPDPTAIASLLTPTNQTYYNSGRTPVPIAVPGVPTCLTATYRGEAFAYAELWREITAGVTDPAALAELEQMICEGLLYDLSGVEPTATVNPNALVVATPTAMEAAPVTTGGSESGYALLLIDVETGVRQYAPNLLMVSDEAGVPNVLTLLTLAFIDQFGTDPGLLRISPDEQTIARLNGAGYVDLYRLARPLSALITDEDGAIGTRAAQGPRSIGLAPTATASAQALGASLPTLTPTVTLTPIPAIAADGELPRAGDIEFVCPARRLGTLADARADFVPPGRLIVDPLDRTLDAQPVWTLDPVEPSAAVFDPDGDAYYADAFDPVTNTFTQGLLDPDTNQMQVSDPNTNELKVRRFNPETYELIAELFETVPTVWTLDPRTGELIADDTLLCQGGEGCSISPDGAWVLRSITRPATDLADLVVSRLDGTAARVIYTGEELRTFSPYLTWRAPHTLVAEYPLDLASISEFPITVQQTIDPETGARSEAAPPPTPLPFGRLPFQTISLQPGGSLEVISETVPNGARVYLRDRVTDARTFLGENIQVLAWLPNGRYLYYSDQVDGEGQLFAYDASNGERLTVEETPGGVWSPDGQRTANWLVLGNDRESVDSFRRGEPFAALQVWERETGLRREYCFPEGGLNAGGGSLFWSPDSRYLAFVANLTPDAEDAPTPTLAISPEAPLAANTPIPLEVQYQYGFPRTIVLDTVTGEMIVISTESQQILEWSRIEGEGR